MANDKARIIELQRSLRVAKTALEKIKYGTSHPEGVADEALDEMFRLSPKQDIQGLCGHERGSRR